MRTSRLATVVGGTALAAMLAACGSVPLGANQYPVPVTYPSSTMTAPPQMGAEYGRVSNIEYVPGGTARSGPNVGGAILGAVAGAVLGNQIGSGSGRDVATVVGGAAGAAVGSQVGRTTSTTDAVYRITVTTDQGVTRVYDVPATGDLHVGDRVRVESGVIYRA